MTELTLFHTAEVHRETFDRIAAQIAPDATLNHVVRPDWLARAQNGLTDNLVAEIQQEISQSANSLCTCTTIGEVAARAGAIRIDRPMMDAAVQTDSPVLLAYCLDSTYAPSTALLEQSFAACNRPPSIRSLPLTELWHLFEAGKTTEFAKQIAVWVDSAAALQPDLGCVVLAQASMAGATEHVTTKVPVLASPELALRAALEL